MTIKEVEEQIEDVKKYFPFVKIKIHENKGSSLAPQVEFKRGERSTKGFITNFDDLLSLCISCHGSVQYQVGRNRGIEEGKTMKVREFVTFLGLEEVKDDIEDIYSRMNRF